ncbi:MAG TPA: PQQ-dependent sugar dehydrogenase [Chryseolinea sp.]|nr:PQQ-dependent sugar dehydrogenase [Chryseolinea sp.]
MFSVSHRVISAFLGVLMGTNLSIAQTYPADFGQVVVANGITDPTTMAFAPDGRIFVAQQAGKLRVIKNNALLPTPFISLTVSSSGERGLLGIAIDPDFLTNNYIYLYYTVPGSPPHNRISRFTADGDVALVGSESIVLELDPLSGATIHNGGAMHFGKDGKLYVAIGENGTSSNAQNLDTYHGKLLRINKDGSVPAGNPFTTGSEQRKRVWAYGLRNPYTFSIHPTTGRILVNDVGQGTWEEINDATTGGKNFGWPTTEGIFNSNTYPTFTNPIYAYPHGSGDGKGCAIVGGTFFSPTTSNYPSSYLGRYFFQEFCNVWINTLDLSGGSAVRAPFATGISGGALAITVGPDGNLYYLGRSADALFKIIYNNATSPFITNQPADLTVGEGQNAVLSVSALGSTPLSYQWRKNGNNIPGATNSTLAFSPAALANSGNYTVVVSNASGNVTSEVATLTVLQNAPPVAEILTPVTGTTYVAGTNINFSGSGTDAEDGELQANAFSWEIHFHHDTHNHDQPAIDDVKQGSFLVPNVGETSDNVWYRIILTITDSQGLIGKDSVDVLPQKSTLNILSSPTGLQVTLDGQPVTTPHSVVSVEGMLRTIGVVSPQVKNGITYNFLTWSNDGDETQTITVPTDDMTLTAKYSHVVGLEMDLYNDKISIYPNPSTRGTVTIKVVSEIPQTIRIQLIDLLSREIAEQSAQLSPGNNELIFNYGKARKGIYSLLIEMKDKTISKRLAVSD